MGEFLLHILGFDHDGTVIFTKHLKGSHYKVGDAVPFVYPNQDRKTKRFYYRILEKFYDPHIIIELLKSKDPNVIDKDGFVQYQRILRGKDMYNLTLAHHSFQDIATQYKWHKHAVEFSVKRYLDWIKENDDSDLDTEPKLTPEQLTAEQIAKREALLAQWD